METINIFISHNKVNSEVAATTNQIKYLRALCTGRNIEFPFKSLQACKQHLKRFEASRAINELVEKGNMVVFIYPKEYE